jgi:hypothetical protein
MAKGLAEATDMVGGALFDQSKSEQGWDDEVWARTSVGPQDRFTASISSDSLQPPLYSSFSHFGISRT